MNREEVYSTIDKERELQDQTWGGPEHDSCHSVADWLVFMEVYINKTKQLYTDGAPEYLVIEKIVKTAALSVAALEYLTEE